MDETNCDDTQTDRQTNREFRDLLHNKPFGQIFRNNGLIAGLEGGYVNSRRDNFNGKSLIKVKPGSYFGQE